ncbi:MAG: DUF1800 domain-containing protein [Microbacteriaceae bacterium]|nr:DUF1800 domain-containing protein [Burkholderiaceae bacterium]
MTTDVTPATLDEEDFALPAAELTPGPTVVPTAPSLPSLAALFGSVAALAACGGGGGDSPSAAPSPVTANSAPPGSATDTALPAPTPAAAPAPTAAPTPAPTPAPVAALTDADAARFLAQAGFAASSADIASVKAQGFSAWLDGQLAQPPSAPSHFDWMLAKGYGDATFRYNFTGLDNTLWRKALSAPDQLRQRVVLALSEIFVISMGGVQAMWGAMGVAAYVDMLEERAFGSYRDLLGGVALSCGMGIYLNMRGNQKEDLKTGRMPDENFARELMQLMTIGLVHLNLDGSPVLDGAGKPKETYALSHISDLARVLTGWDFDLSGGTADPAFMKKPMINTAAKFSVGAKKVLNVDIPASADGPAALKIALDTLAGHANVAPFIGRQLIQRLVCSNPSPAYVQRVAMVFNSSGGSMKAVIKAVLLDTEARTVGAGPATGKLREPVQRFVQWGRTFGVSSPTDAWNVGDTSNPGNRLGQSPLRSPSVFNFFRPGYVPPNSQLGSNRVTAPEFQLCNESTVAGYLNFMQSVIASGIGEVKPDYTAELALATDAVALFDRVALLLAANSLSAATRSTIATAVGGIKADTAAGKLNRVQATVLLVMASPEYLVQK